MIGVLDRKLLRDLRTMRGQIVAIVLIIACGVASLVGVFTAYRGLKGSRDAYYARYRMADLFASVRRAPRAATRRLETIRGVRRVEGRIVFEVTLDLPDLAQPASGRVISVPDRPERILNDLHLTRGRWFDGDGTREVIVAERFAREHGYEIGDSIGVIMNNKKESLRIVATALSPEFVYLIRGGGEVMPDPKHFTVLWMSRTFAEAVFDFEDACNDFVATLDPGAPIDDVIEAFDRALDPYGAFGAYARADQLSNRFLSDEIKGLKGSATLVPMIFLAVAAFVLHMLLNRLVRTQRTQIAVLRAFGHDRAAIVGHYLKLAVIVGAGGGVVGAGAGLWFASWMGEAYAHVYSFPVLVFHPDPLALVVGCAGSLGFAALGAFQAARAASRLEPAEAMRPEAPRTFGRIWVERIVFLWRRLGFAPRMILRNISRTKLRATISVGAVALATSILMLAFFSADAVDELLDIFFRLQERQDVRVAFHEERGRTALFDVRRLEGVRTVEPERIVAVRLVNGWRSERTAITGLAPDQSLRGLLDRDRRAIPMPHDGLLLSRKLAEIVGVRVGDVLEAQVLTGKKQRFTVPVENVVEDFLGTFAYADWRQLSRWMREDVALTGAVLQVDPARADALGRELKSLPAVAAVGFKARAVQGFRDTVAASQGVMTGTLIVFAGIITFGVIYNATRISLAERQRELGSMMVLGFTAGEVGAVLMGENLLLAVAAIGPGLGLGTFFAWLLSVLYDTDLFRFPFVIVPSSLVKTAFIVFAFALLANLAVRRRLGRLDVVEVLKERE